MATDRPTRLSITLAVAVLALAFAGGCGGTRVPTESLTSSEIDRIAAAVDATAHDLLALRGTGSALLSSQDHRTPFAFAVVYDRAGWLRADIRPSSPAAPSGFTAQLLVERECASLLFPSSLLMVTGCLDAVPFGDPALLLFGAVSGDDILRLVAPIASEDHETLRLTGRRGETLVELALDREAYRLVSIDIRGEDDEWLSIEYDGHGWKESLPLPRTTIIKFGRKGRTQARLRIEFDRLRVIDAVDRTGLDLVIPPGTTVSGWEDLALWR